MQTNGRLPLATLGQSELTSTLNPLLFWLLLGTLWQACTFLEPFVLKACKYPTEAWLHLFFKIRPLGHSKGGALRGPLLRVPHVK